MIDLSTVPQRETFPVSVLTELLIEHFPDTETTPERRRANVMRAIYRRIESGDIEATRKGLFGPLVVPRAEVIRILTGDIK